MKKSNLINYGGIVLFYLFILVCLFVMNMRFEYLNEMEMPNNTYAFNN